MKTSAPMIPAARAARSLSANSRCTGTVTVVLTHVRSGEVQIQTGHRAAFSYWNRLVTVLCGRRSNTAPAASKCYNRPNDADSWRNHKNIFAVILPLKSKA
jgi:hypothetical protein